MVGLEESIEVITYPSPYPNKVEKGCRDLTSEIEELAKPLDVETSGAPVLLNKGIVFDIKKKIICLNPVSFAYILKDIHEKTGISFEKLVWVFVEHERGHFELRGLGLEPVPSEDELDERYMTIYSKFEDYGISRFLRNERYIEIEKYSLRSEFEEYVTTEIKSLAEIKSLNNLCGCALCAALDYIKREELNFSSIPLKYINLISSKMNGINKLQEIPDTVHNISPKLPEKENFLI